MNKKEGLQLFGFESEPSQADFEMRQKQLLAFFHAENDSKMSPLAKLFVAKIEEASAQFAQAQQKSEPKNEYKTDQTAKQANEKTENKSESAGFIKFLFPEPIDSAGAFLSDQWWRVYKRIVLLGLAFIGAVFIVGPKMIPKSEPHRSPDLHNYEKLLPNDPDDNRYKEIGPGDVEKPPELTPEIKSILDPQANPTVNTPSQNE